MKNEHLVEALRKGVRMDGRKLDEFRKLTITRGTVATAEGSAHVLCGDTEVIAGVKLDVGAPYPDKPDAGTLMVNAELRPISNPEFELGPPSIESIEVSRVIDRTIRESKVIDEKKLCIKPGESVWTVNVDIVPLNTNGNLIDIGGIAAIAALQDTKLPKLVDGKADYHEKTAKGLPLEGVPIPVTIVKIGDNLLVDPTEEELEASDARLTVGCLDDLLCALQKGGKAPLRIEEIDAMIELAMRTAKQIRKVL